MMVRDKTGETAAEFKGLTPSPAQPRQAAGPSALHASQSRRCGPRGERERSARGICPHPNWSRYCQNGAASPQTIRCWGHKGRTNRLNQA